MSTAPVERVIIPAGLPDHIWTWSSEELMLFLKANQARAGVDDDDLNRLKKLAGVHLSELTEDFLIRCGLELIPAHGISLLIERLKEGKENNANDRINPSGLPEELRLSLALVLSQKNQSKPTKRDVTQNKITLEKLDHSLDGLQGNAKLFVEKLMRKVPYPLGDEAANDVDTLKRILGTQFDAQFSPDNIDEDRPTATLRELTSYINAVRRLGNLPNYHDGFTALAKEVCLIGVIVDPAIEVLVEAYNRDKIHAFIELKKKKTEELYDIWYPRNDFNVAFDEGGRGYALLHGETDSSGQSEEDAMCKNALLSLHSWKSMHKIHHKEDPVILYVYVSAAVCSMYIFFKDKPDEFKFRCILYEKDLFNSGPKIVGFLRWLHNFAAMARKYQISLPEEDEDDEDPMADIPSPWKRKMDGKDKDNGGPDPKKIKESAKRSE